MNDLRKAAEMALEALETIKSSCREGRTAHAENEAAIVECLLRQALLQALAQEWVCCVCGDPKALGIVHSADAPCFHYTKREWVGLTDAEVAEYWRDAFAENTQYVQKFARIIEAKLKEKNS